MTGILVNIDVDTIEPAERFYCAAFELSVGRRFGAGAVELVGGSSRIYLLEKSEGTRATDRSEDRRSYERHWTPVHLDFVVDDLQEAIGRSIAAGGIQEQSARETAWGRIAVMSDPFGHGYCLITFSAEGYDAIASTP
jgi:predicted enzyme related to lactoylglutathione lyase